MSLGGEANADGRGRERGHPYLGGDCPRWCDMRHLEEDHPEDQIHSSEPLVVPVVELLHSSSGGLLSVPSALDVALFQYPPLLDEYVGVAGDEWIFIGSGPSSLTLTKESARRLYRALGKTLQAVDS